MAIKVEDNDETIITLVAAVIDESGSMSNVTVETINGYNTFISDIQKEQAGKKAYVSTFLFDSGYTSYDGSVSRPMVRTIQDTVAIENATPLSTDNYRPNGGTPLYDAIGTAIATIDKAVADKGINRVTLLIQTDGQENASKEYSHATVTDLIKKRTDAGWQIIFLGADLANAVNIGRGLGVAAANSMAYSKGLTADTFTALSASTTAYRSSLNASVENTLSDSDKARLATGLGGTHQTWTPPKATKSDRK